MFPCSGGRRESRVQMSEGISAARTSASLFCVLYILFLLFILVPFLFSLVGSSHLPLFCSSQRNSTTHCCRFALFFIFFSFLRTAPLLTSFHTSCGSPACRRRAAAGLPSNVSASYHCSSTSAAPGEEAVAGEEIEEAGVGET